MHEDPGERSSDPTKDRPRLAHECPAVSGRGVGQQWPAAGLGALSVAVHSWDLLKEIAIIFITSTIVWPQVNNREKEMATHSSVLAWRIPGMGEPGGMSSMGFYRVRHG